MNFLESAERAITLLETVWSRFAAVILFLIMLIVLTDVGMRYFLNSPLDWAFELITLYLMAALFFLSLSHTLHHNHHVRVDLLFLYVSARARAGMECIGYGLSLVLFALIFQQGVKRALHEWSIEGVIDGAFPWPTWISSAMVPLGVSVILLRLAVYFVRTGMRCIAPDSPLADGTGEFDSAFKRNEELH
jgi:TRAP-type C4-dicarboxylate transport system permease small subunit